MKLSKKMRYNLYDAITLEIVEVRIKLKLPSDQDYILAQVENKIWANQKSVLKLQE